MLKWVIVTLSVIPAKVMIATAAVSNVFKLSEHALLRIETTMDDRMANIKAEGFWETVE